MPRSEPVNELIVERTEPAPIALNDLVTQIKEAHGQVEQAFTAAVGHALKAGELLLEAKSQLDHGKFEPWIKANFEFSGRMARAYMRVAEKFPELPDEKRQRVSDMSLRGLLKLFASPKAGRQPKRQLVNLAEVKTANLVAELVARNPRDAEPGLLMLVRKWADAAGNEIIVRPKKTDESETPEHISAEKTKVDLLTNLGKFDRRNEAPGTNYDEEIPSQSPNQERKNG
jgi:hypothetical protein